MLPGLHTSSSHMFTSCCLPSKIVSNDEWEKAEQNNVFWRDVIHFLLKRQTQSMDRCNNSLKADEQLKNTAWLVNMWFVLMCVHLCEAHGHSRARKSLEHNQSLGSQAVWSALWAGYCNSYKQRLLSNQWWGEERGNLKLGDKKGNKKSSNHCQMIELDIFNS